LSKFRSSNVSRHRDRSSTSAYVHHAPDSKHATLERYFGKPSPRMVLRAKQ
jgi:hypothetical protein